jgi:hypothetical protein
MIGGAYAHRILITMRCGFVLKVRIITGLKFYAGIDREGVY